MNENNETDEPILSDSQDEFNQMQSNFEDQMNKKDFFNGWKSMSLVIEED